MFYLSHVSYTWDKVSPWHPIHLGLSDLMTFYDHHVFILPEMEVSEVSTVSTHLLMIKVIRVTPQKILNT